MSTLKLKDGRKIEKEPFNDSVRYGWRLCFKSEHLGKHELALFVWIELFLSNSVMDFLVIL